MTPELEFATMTAFDRIEISKGAIDGVIERWHDNRFHVYWTDSDSGDDEIVQGTALDAMQTLIHMMNTALANQERQS